VEVLRDLPVLEHPATLVGIETADDAAVFLLTPQLAIVQTVDFFSPIVDDPFQFGQIAAANSLSDIYAMGGKPIFALNIAGFPSGRLPLNVLREIFRGGAEKAREAGIPILGGHTVHDDEPKYGLVATGVCDPKRVVRNIGACPGDQLVLTKGLGTGVIANAVKRQACPSDMLIAAVQSMSELNRDAAEVMNEIGVHAATDVTGFGLIGHLHGMLRSSKVSAVLWADRIPLLKGVSELIAGGFVPGGTQRNMAYYEGYLDAHGVSYQDLIAVHDAQTSGGLLLCVAKEKLSELIDALKKRGTFEAAHIGMVVEGVSGDIVFKHEAQD
jgi:selenium donor protein